MSDYARFHHEFYQNAWIGDAFLKAFVKLELIYRYPKAPRNRLGWMADQCLTNENLEQYAQRHPTQRLPDRPKDARRYDAVEALAGVKVSEQCWDAVKTLAAQIVDDWVEHHVNLVDFVERRDLSWQYIMKGKRVL